MKLLAVFLAAVILLTGLLALNACQAINSPFEDYTWILISRNEAGINYAPPEGARITVVFNSKTKVFNGSGGCNPYGGSYKVDGLTLTVVGNLVMTEIACSPAVNEQEIKYVEALKAAETFKMEHGNLVIYCNKQILTFERQQP